jgi:hypothetical protein
MVFIYLRVCFCVRVLACLHACVVSCACVRVRGMCVRVYARIVCVCSLECLEIS